MDGGSYIQYPIIQQTRPKALSGGKIDRILRESLTTQHIKDLELAVIKSIELLTGDMYLVRRTEFINITGLVRQADLPAYYPILDIKCQELLLLILLWNY